MAEQSAGELVQKFRDRELGAEQLVAEIAALRPPSVPVKSEAVRRADGALWQLERYRQQ